MHDADRLDAKETLSLSSRLSLPAWLKCLLCQFRDEIQKPPTAKCGNRALDSSGVIASSNSASERRPLHRLIVLTMCAYTGTIGTMKKVRTVIYLEEPERKGLEALSKKTGARLTELVRRAVVDYLKRQK